MEPVFKPWQGKIYGSSDIGGFKLLVLGESHYGGSQHANADVTQWVVEHHISGEQKLPFFTKVGSLLANRKPFNAYGNPEVLNAVAFYNFVQRFPGEQHSDRPSDEDWKNAMQPFLQVLTDLRPHAVLVLGQETWGHIPFRDGTNSNPDGSDKQRLWVRPDGWRVATTVVTHPQWRGGWKAADYQHLVDDLLERGLNLCDGERRADRATTGWLP